jgi:hypothetical protein
MFPEVPYDDPAWMAGPGYWPGDTWEPGPEYIPAADRRPPWAARAGRPREDRLRSARRRALKFMVDVGRWAARGEVLSHVSTCTAVELDAILAELVAAGLVERREVLEVVRYHGGGRVAVVQYRPATGGGEP